MSSKHSSNGSVMRYAEFTNFDPIGEGGYGKVYRAIHSSGRTVAYKKFDIHITPPEAKKLLLEASIHARLDHPCIVKMIGLVFDHDQETKNYGLVLEFMEKGDMLNCLQSEKVEYKSKLLLLSNVASGMSYLHAQSPPIIHGDLKITNVLISDNNVAKICDFGFSQLKEYSQSTSVNQVRIGTVTHIPPEIWENCHRRKNEKCDVYGFGVMLWETMTEEKPFRQAQGRAQLIDAWVSKGERPDPEMIPQDVSAEVKELMALCWHQKPDLRPTFPDVESSLKDEIRKTSGHASGDHSSQDSNSTSPTSPTSSNMPFERPLKLLEKFPIKEDNGKQGVAGIAVFQDHLYILVEGSSKVLVYLNKKPFNRSINEDIDLPEMKHSFDMVVEKVSRAIFISDDIMRCLWKIKLPGKDVGKHDTKGQPYGISLNRKNGLVVVVRSGDSYHNLDIYDSMNVEHHRVYLPREINATSNAVETSTGNYIIAYRNKKNVGLISEVSSDGKTILQTLDPQLTALIELKNWHPVHLAIDEYDRLFIADSHKEYGGHRVFLMNPQFTGIQQLSKKTWNSNVNTLQRLCLDRNQLVIGQANWSTSCISICNITL